MGNQSDMREAVDAHLDEIVVSNIEDAVEEIDLTESLTDDQVQELFDAFQEEDWQEVDRIIDEFDKTGVFNLLDDKAGGADRNRGGAEKLRRYWTVGEGGQKIRWGVEGDWTRCVALVSKHLGPRAKGYCALRHKEMNGFYPGSKLNKGASPDVNDTDSIYHESKDGHVAPETGVTMLEHKTVGVKGMKVVSPEEGIVETIISVTNIVDNVKDRILPGAYEKTLAKRKPKGVWSHDWETPVSKTLDVKELMPGDPELPKTMPDGQPWPADAGALKVKTQFNLDTQRGREAYSDVTFFAEEQEWSIGYNVPVGGAKVDQKSGVRDIGHLELYEYSPVLFGAMPLARTTSVKEAQLALKALKGGAASWLATTSASSNPIEVIVTEVEPTEEFTAEPTADEEDALDELDGKSYDLAADQMILVKRAIETLTNLLEVVQAEVKEDMPEDEPEEYESLVEAIDGVVDDEDLKGVLSEAAQAVDDALEQDDADALNEATSAFLDTIETEMGKDGADEATLKEVAAILSDMIDSLPEEAPSEEDAETKGICPECGGPIIECKGGCKKKKKKKKSEEAPEDASEDEAEEKRQYNADSRDKMAKSGEAMEDGSYPIKDEADLRNAIQAIGRAKDPEAAKAHIKKRAKALGLEDLIPDSWGDGKVLLSAEEIAAFVQNFNAK